MDTSSICCRWPGGWACVRGRSSMAKAELAEAIQQANDCETRQVRQRDD
jgi:hypothetical protein